MIRVALAVVLTLVLATPALASEEKPTVAEVERELVCPTCEQPLALSNAPIADRMRAFIRERIAAGDTKTEIKDELVAQFGEGVLAAPPKSGFDILAWALPLGGIVLAGVIIALLARHWRRRYPEPEPEPSANGRPPLDPDLERRLDEELARFES